MASNFIYELGYSLLQTTTSLFQSANTHWKIKFPSAHEQKEVCAIEDFYLEMAKEFGIERTIIDSFRLLDRERAMRALKIYMSGSKGKPNIKKLNK